ncbi:MAG TPA: YIP1 family protein [Candidatus Aquilonibacter sp.]|nr:YIP1 family protein [Candidatus Aquilonibacter sp.]
MATTATEAPEASGNSFTRIFGVFFSPKETFASIARRPTWIVPVILSCLVSVALFQVFGSRVGWQRAVERNIQNNPITARQMDQLSPEQRQQSINVQVKIYPYILYSIGVVGPFIFTLLLAALFLGLFKLGYGSQVDIKQSMGIVAYASMPRVLYALVGILVIFLKDPSQVDIQNLRASNPGALLGPDTARWLVVLATQFDFFTFWVMFLLAIGYSATNPKKISVAGAFTGIVGLWLVWVMVVVGITAAFS